MAETARKRKGNGRRSGDPPPSGPELAPLVADPDLDPAVQLAPLYRSQDNQGTTATFGRDATNSDNFRVFLQLQYNFDPIRVW